MVITPVELFHHYGREVCRSFVVVFHYGMGQFIVVLLCYIIARGGGTGANNHDETSYGTG